MKGGTKSSEKRPKTTLHNNSADETDSNTAKTERFLKKVQKSFKNPLRLSGKGV